MSRQGEPEQRGTEARESGTKTSGLGVGGAPRESRQNGNPEGQRPSFQDLSSPDAEKCSP